MIHTVVFDNEIKLWWDCVKGLSENDGFFVINGSSEFFVPANRTNISFSNLKPETEYLFGLYKFVGGNRIFMQEITVKTLKSKNKIDVTKPPYNAVGDGKTLNTLSLQRAINDCGADDCVYFPNGVYLTGALDLCSNVELLLADNAVLQGTENPADYLPKIKSRFEGELHECYRSLLNAGSLDEKADCNTFNIVVRGGKIFGGGEALRVATIEAEKPYFLKKYGYDGVANPPGHYSSILPGRQRGRLAQLSNVQNFIIADCEFGNAASWNFHAIFCKDIITCGCKIVSKKISNGDGWDPDSSENCVIFDTIFDTGDDCVAIKSGKNLEGYLVGRPSKNIKVFDCVALGGHGVAIGSEMSGGVENVEVWNCDFEICSTGIVIKTNAERGGYVKNASFYNCIVPVLKIECKYNSLNVGGIAAPEPPKISDIAFENITVTGICHAAGNGRILKREVIDIDGYEGDFNTKNIIIKDIKIRHNLLSTYHDICINDCKNVEIENIQSENL